MATVDSVTSHVSIRLFWHDSGWNGAICRDPASNVWCEAHEHVRDKKLVGEEQKVAGKDVNGGGVKPVWELSVQAFSHSPNVIRVWPPDWMEAWNVRPV